eukprot:GEMP01048618.1.p1 GENE.GEMP01048618.1~~GEMP01048618.1.p1  ORF type:complete len:346 (-),score=16.69 GEMP01048618.1:487-1524(-)
MASHMMHTAPGANFGESLNPLHTTLWVVLKSFLCVFRRKEGEFGYYLDNYEGNSRLYCRGRVVMGPSQVQNVSCTLLCTIIPSIYFLVSILPEYEGYPKEHSTLFWVCVVLLIVVLLAIFICSLSNPGIIPRNLNTNDGDEMIYPGHRYHTRYYMVHGVVLKQKYCSSCKIYRPPRSKHCVLCDNCVLRFDHHCMILGTCVGLHNYRWFLVLIYCGNLLAVVAMTVSISLLWSIIQRDSSGIVETCEILVRRIVLACFCIYSVILCMAVVLLGFYHTGITSRNLTTNEHVKNYYKVNPFDFGAWKNCSHTCLYPEALMIEPMQMEEPGYIRLGSTNSECLSFDDI